MTEDSPDESEDARDENQTPTADRTAHERMERYVDLAETAQRTHREKAAVLGQVSEELADLDVVDIASDGAYPDTNFSKF